MQIIFHQSNSGRVYFEAFLAGISTQDRAVVLAIFEDIKENGFAAVIVFFM